MQGLELSISSGKAAEGAKLFEAVVEAAAKAAERMGTVVEKLDRVLLGLGKEFEQTTARGKAMQKVIEDLDPIYGRLGATVAATGKKLDASGLAIEKVGKQSQDGAKATRELAGSVTTLGIAASTVTGVIARLGAAAGVFLTFRSIVTSIGQAEDQLRIFGAVTHATTDELGKASTAAQLLAQSSRFSFAEGVATLSELGRAGVSATDSIKALPTIANLARAGVLSLNDAAGIVISTMAQFGTSVDRAGHIADALTLAADSTKSSVSSLGDSLDKVGVIGKAVGADFDLVIASLAQLQQNGVQATIAGRGLGSILGQLAAPAGRTAQELAKLNVEWNGGNTLAKNFGQTLLTLRDKNLTLAQATKLVGEEFDGLLLALVKDAPAVNALAGAIDKAGGESARKATATVGTLRDELALLSNAVDTFARSAGEAGLSGALATIAKTGADALNVLAGDKQALKNASAEGKALAASLELAGVATGAFVGYQVAQKVAAWAVAIRAATVATVSYDAATGVAIGTTRAFTVALLANPITALVTVIGAAAAAWLIYADHTDKAAEAAAKSATQLKEQRDRLAEIRSAIDGLKDIGSAFALPAEKQAALQKAADKIRFISDAVVKLGKGAQVPLRDLLPLGNIDAAIAKQTVLLEQQAKLDKPGFRVDRDQRIELTVQQADAQKLLADAIRSVAAQAAAAGVQLVGVDNVLNGLEEAPISLEEGFSRLWKTFTEGGASVTKQKDALQEFLNLRRRDVEIAGLSEPLQLRAKLLQDAINAAINAGHGLRLRDLRDIEQIAQALERAKKGTQKQQLFDDLEREVESLEQVGAERQAISKELQVQAFLQKNKIQLDEDEQEKLQALLAKYHDLKVADSERTGSVKRENALLQNLDDEESLVGKIGKSYRDAARAIEATNAARQAGLKGDEAADYVRRRVALDEYNERLRDAVAIGEDVGQSVGDAFIKLSGDIRHAGDAAKSLFQDLVRIGLQRLVVANLVAGFGAAAGAIFGGAPNPEAGRPEGFVGPPPPGGFSSTPRLTGGLLPALSGRVIDSPSILQRGSQQFSVAEGGATTPEVVLRLQRDSNGNLGVAAASGGGDVNQTMVFPNVRNRQDARQVRATLSQQARAIAEAAGGGRRRGFRP